jgi:hypothetical protein
MGTTRMQTKTEVGAATYCVCCGQFLDPMSHGGCQCTGCERTPNHCRDCGFPISSPELQDWHAELTCEGVCNARYS